MFFIEQALKFFNQLYIMAIVADLYSKNNNFINAFHGTIPQKLGRKIIGIRIFLKMFLGQSRIYKYVMYYVCIKLFTVV